MKFINIRKLKFYTKEIIKIFNILLLVLGVIIAIILIKYKPMYEVSISGQKVGYVLNKKVLNNTIKENIENFKNSNISKVKLTEFPQYELKLVEKSKKSNTDEIIILLQKKLEIEYKYYEIAINNQKVENVGLAEEAENIINYIKEQSNDNLDFTINEKTTSNIETLDINSIDVAKNNIMRKLNIKNSIANIEGIKISTLPVSGTISSRYGASSSIRSANHTGLDIAAPLGTKIKAVADGTVTFANSNASYGYLIKLEHGNGIETWYAHTSKMYVTIGQKVKSGDVIALVGNTGNSTGPHLHLEVRINGEHVNPQKYLYR